MRLQREDMRREKKRFQFNSFNIALGHMKWIWYKQGSSRSILNLYMVITHEGKQSFLFLIDYSMYCVIYL